MKKPYAMSAAISNRKWLAMVGWAAARVVREPRAQQPIKGHRDPKRAMIKETTTAPATPPAFQAARANEALVEATPVNTSMVGSQLKIV